MSNIQNELDRLNFEDWIFIIFIAVAALNIYGDNLLKKYIKENNKYYENKANEIFIITIFITILIYIYFLKRNYNFYVSATPERKNMLSVKVLSSIFLLIGAILLLYFQIKDSNFLSAPNI